MCLGGRVVVKLQNSEEASIKFRPKGLNAQGWIYVISVTASLCQSCAEPAPQYFEFAISDTPGDFSGLGTKGDICSNSFDPFNASAGGTIATTAKDMAPYNTQPWYCLIDTEKEYYYFNIRFNKNGDAKNCAGTKCSLYIETPWY